MTTFANPKARWDYRFATPAYIFGTEPNAFLASQKDRLPQGKGLSVADGEGRNSVWLAEQGLQVDAFDFSEPAVAKARHLAERRQVKVAFHLSDWQSFAWPSAHYDCVAGIFFQFVDAQDRAVLFQRMSNSLKSGGLMLIQGYSPAQLKFNTGGPGELSHLYDEALMRASFPGYHVLELRTYEAQVQEGAAHQGMSGLLGFAAIKPA